MTSTREQSIRKILAEIGGRPLSPQGIVAVVSPSVKLIYPDEWRRLNGLLRAAGAAALMPVVSGIPKFAARCAESIHARGPGLHILSACPAAIDFIAGEYPALSPAILPVASPMAISAEAALGAAGIPGGTAVAISSCSLKKREESRVPFDMRVIGVRRFLGELVAAGIDLGDFDESDFDPWRQPGHAAECEIACIVEEALSARGVENASVIKLEGTAAARKTLSRLLAAGGPPRGSTLAVELTFCENGCVREPEY
ncbi:hypothetical protein LWX53_08515 [bacterium]|nr:hypothetical protein [bacterium]